MDRSGEMTVGVGRADSSETFRSAGVVPRVRVKQAPFVSADRTWAGLACGLFGRDLDHGDRVG